MPSKSDKQKRLMVAVANNPEFAKKVGIPQSVGKEYEREDKKMNCGSKRKMAAGGMTGFTPCAACPNPAGCAAKGKCALKGKGKSKDKPKAMKEGGLTMAKKDPRYRAPRGSKGPMYDAMLDAEAEKKRKRTAGKSKPSEAVQTMRRQQKELDTRMADMPKMKKGGKVRGCGMAKKGTRPAKMM